MYTITSRENQQIKAIIRLQSSRKERYEQKLFVIEGMKLLGEAILSGITVTELYLTKEQVEKNKDFCASMENSSTQIYEITPEIAAKIADTKTPQGVFSVCRMLDIVPCTATIKDGGKFLFLSSLQDPGNMGTIIRTCEAFGIDHLFLSADCPDVYSAKVLRASMGGLFRLPFTIVEDSMEAIHTLQQQGIRVYGTALTKDSIDITQVDFKSTGTALVIGNEGNGLSQEMIAACDQTVLIPMKGRAESLNAAIAAGVAIWEMTR